MRHLGLCAVLLGACIPDDPDWVTEARFRGVQVGVVEPGGYSSLLNVPPGSRRATALPLDTVELAWQVAVPPGDELEPPIWIACSLECTQKLTFNLFDIREIKSLDLAELADCPHPLPLYREKSCRLGEGHQIRVGLGGAFTAVKELTWVIPLIVVGSRSPDLTPATCLERLANPPLEPSASCLFGVSHVLLGPSWAALPFDSDYAAAPPEILDQEADTNPVLAGFAVTRRRGGQRIELVAAPGDVVPMRRGERITVGPLYADGSVQEYWRMIGGEKDVPWSGRLSMEREQLEWRVWFTAPVKALDSSGRAPWDRGDLSWTVPHDVEPTTLYFDVRDGRAGTAYGELHFVPDDSAQ